MDRKEELVIVFEEENEIGGVDQCFRAVTFQD